MTKRKKQIQQEELLRLVSIHFNITGFEKFEYCTNHEKIDIFLVLTNECIFFSAYSTVNKIYKTVGFY